MSIETFAKNRIVQGLSRPQIERMFSAGREKTYGAGEVVVRENQILDSLYVLLSGEVSVYLPESEIRPAQIDITTKTMNDCFGEYSLVDHQPASASIRTLSDCVVYIISHVAFEDYLESDRVAGSIVYKNLLVVLVERLRADNAELDLFNLV
jgi:CRP-like cAMP-binding protein